MTNRGHGRIGEGIEQCRCLCHGTGHVHIHILRFHTAGSKVGDYKIAGIVTGKTVGNGTSQVDLPLLGAGKGIQVQRSTAIAQAYNNVCTQTGQRNIGIVRVRRKAGHGLRVHIEQAGNRFLAHAGAKQAGNSLLHGIGAFGNAIVGLHGNGSARIQVVFGFFVVGFAIHFQEFGMRGNLAGNLYGGKVFQIRDQDFGRLLIDDCRCFHIFHHQGNQGAGRRLGALAGNDNLTGFPARIRKRELVFFRKVQHPQFGTYLVIGLQFRLNAQFHHVDERFLIGDFRIIERDRNLQVSGVRVRDGQFGQFLPCIRALYQDGSKAGKSLPFGGGCYIFRLMAGNHGQQHDRKNIQILFHTTSIHHIGSQANWIPVPIWASGSGTDAPGSYGFSRPRTHRCNGSHFLRAQS